MNWTEFELLTKEQLYEIVIELEDERDRLQDKVESLETNAQWLHEDIAELKFKLSCQED